MRSEHEGRRNSIDRLSRHSRLRLALLSLLLAAPLTAQEHALAIARDVERLAASRSFWPGFEPLAIPLAIYDGKRT
ncbi:MAG TPA: hypothetical protein VFB46_13525, partial [Gemmatimonadaceae bacterium]|nr:hypothetical protein [Gemmatimonadaceae bacterium]